LEDEMDDEVGLHESADQREEEMIETCCILWDISGSIEHTQFLFDHQIFPVFFKILTSPHSDRLIEVVLGTIGNMVTVSPSVVDYLAGDVIAEVILHSVLFETDDPCVLAEVARIITACVSSSLFKDKWIQKLKTESNFVQQILNILGNTLNQELVDRMLILVATLVHIPSFFEESVTCNITSLISQLLKDFTSKYQDPYSTTVNESAIDLCLRILEVLETSPNLVSLQDIQMDVLPSLLEIVKNSDSEDLIESTLQLLASVASDSTVLAQDPEFCRALMNHLSTDIQSALSLLIMIMGHREGLEIVVECIDSLLSLSSMCDEDEILKKAAITKLSNCIEKNLHQTKRSTKYEQVLHKIRQ